MAENLVDGVEVMGPRNRLGKLTRTESVRLMLGQRMPAINFREVLDEGHIILVNLSGGPRASDMSCELLGRLLTRFLFFNAQRRQHPERPFFFYLDECQLYHNEGPAARNDEPHRPKEEVLIYIARTVTSDVTGLPAHEICRDRMHRRTQHPTRSPRRRGRAAKVGR
jgi:hypothetical protein